MKTLKMTLAMAALAYVAGSGSAQALMAAGETFHPKGGEPFFVEIFAKNDTLRERCEKALGKANDGLQACVEDAIKFRDAAMASFLAKKAKGPSTEMPLSMMRRIGAVDMSRR